MIATRRIRQLSGSLKLKPHHVDAANRIYKLALQRNFTNGNFVFFSRLLCASDIVGLGRKRDHVVAACLYVVIRRTGAPHMLVDLCDVLEDMNVKTLGHTFLELCQTLNIQPPIIDPSLYIHVYKFVFWVMWYLILMRPSQRFSSQLEFGDKEQLVAETALRFVQRMNRDWIQTGRRPSGVCGAGT